MNRIEDEFESFQKSVIPPDASETQVGEMRRAFFAGAASVMMVFHIIGADAITEEEAERIMVGIDRELLQFKDGVISGQN